MEQVPDAACEVPFEAADRVAVPPGHGAPGLLEACLAHWRDDHAGLHGYTALREALDRRFTERFFAWAPPVRRVG